MLGSNPSADSVASTDPGGCCAIPLSSVCRHRARIGRGTKAQNPGGAGAKPLRHSLLPLRKPASSHNACIALKSPVRTEGWSANEIPNCLAYDADAEALPR